MSEPATTQGTVAEAPGGLTPRAPLRVLTPSRSGARPFPKAAAIALGVAVLVAIPSSPRGNGVDAWLNGGAMVVAALAMCSIATWLEARIYRRLLGANRFTRMAVTLLMPPLALLVGSLLALVGALTAIIGDDGALALATFLGGAWMSSAAVGTLIIVTLDVLISAIIVDFRSRVQAAVLGLMTISVGVALAVHTVGSRVARHLIGQMREGVPDDNFNVNIGDGELSDQEVMRLLESPETPEVVTAVFLFVALVFALPAILSACGKLADAVMERLNPLAEALDEVGSGHLEVRVEEGGSRDFVKIAEGFNRMTTSLNDTLVDLDERNRDLAEMNRATSRFVPFQFLELLRKASIREIERGDQIQLDISVMFCDIRGFTTMAERMGPEATFGFINRYLGHMEAEIHREQGFINDIFGDGIMALFHTGADAALRAALGMVAAVQRFNELLVGEGKEPIRVGIGMNSGPLMLGTIGGKDRLSCTVVGDPANTAARVEGMTKLYGATLLISEGTRARLQEAARYRFRDVDRVQAKGKREPTAIYEVLEAEPEAARAQKLATLERFAAAVASYRDGAFAEAKEGFAWCRAEAPEDLAAALYVERCNEMLAGGTPEDWDGITRLQTK